VVCGLIASVKAADKQSGVFGDSAQTLARQLAEQAHRHRSSELADGVRHSFLASNPGPESGRRHEAGVCVFNEKWISKDAATDPQLRELEGEVRAMRFESEDRNASGPQPRGG
jgi:hypothetical protein